jgi:DNA polymerase III alpha subunit (gram-positive type)
MNKKYFLYAIVPALLLASAGAVAYASQAQDVNPMAGIVAKIAQKFNLSQNDVQAVFDEYKNEEKTERGAKMQETQAQMEQKVKDELTQAVSDGKLTQAQMDLILAKRSELQAERSTVTQQAQEKSSTKTKEEMEAERDARQTEMKSKQDALKQWATDNGISEEYIRFVGGMPGFGGERRGFDGIKNNQSDAK